MADRFEVSFFRCFWKRKRMLCEKKLRRWQLRQTYLPPNSHKINNLSRVLYCSASRNKISIRTCIRAQHFNDKKFPDTHLSTERKLLHLGIICDFNHGCINRISSKYFLYLHFVLLSMKWFYLWRKRRSYSGVYGLINFFWIKVY